MTDFSGPFFPASPIEIRDGTAARIAAIAGTIGLKKVYKQRTIPTKDEAIPFAAIWHAGERTQPNGDPNVGAPSFFHTLSLVIDVVAKAPADDVLDTRIVDLVEMIRVTLLTDGTWIALFEGIERFDTRYSYPKDTTETVCQAIIEIEATVRSEWEPSEENILNQIAVRVGEPGVPDPQWEGLSAEIDLPESDP